MIAGFSPKYNKLLKINNMDTHQITSYRTNAFVLVVLLALLAINLFLAVVDLGKWNLLAILLLASVQVTIVLNWFMHLNQARWYLKVMAGAVFLLIGIVIVITFFDYLLR